MTPGRPIQGVYDLTRITATLHECRVWIIAVCPVYNVFISMCLSIHYPYSSTVHNVCHTNYTSGLGNMYLKLANITVQQ